MMYVIYFYLKIASEMLVPNSLEKYRWTPRDVEEMKPWDSMTCTPTSTTNVSTISFQLSTRYGLRDIVWTKFEQLG